MTTEFRQRKGVNVADGKIALSLEQARKLFLVKQHMVGGVPNGTFRTFPNIPKF